MRPVCTSAAVRLGALPLETGNAAYCFYPLPYAPVQLILWEGDDEFPAEANILFDATVGDYFPRKMRPGWPVWWSTV